MLRGSFCHGQDSVMAWRLRGFGFNDRGTYWLLPHRASFVLITWWVSYHMSWVLI
jgi:hypothetical protein